MTMQPETLIETLKASSMRTLKGLVSTLYK